MPTERNAVRSRADGVPRTQEPFATADSPSCPFCGGGRTTLISLFGALHLLSQYRCQGCGSYFDGVRPGK